MIRTRVCIALVVLALASACASGRSNFPIVAESLSGDAEASCGALNGELSRVQALRRAIGREQGWEGGADAGLAAAWMFTDPLVGALATAGGVAKSGDYDRAAFAADARIIALETLRTDRACAQPDALTTALLQGAAVLSERRTRDELTQTAFNRERAGLVLSYLQTARVPPTS